MPPAQDPLVSLFRQLSEEADDVFWISDPVDSRVVFLSGSYEKLWGQSPETVYANPRAFLDNIHPEDRDRIEAAHKLQSAGLYDESYRLLRPDGTQHWVHAKAYPIRDESGAVTRICGIARDITATKAAEADSLERQASLERQLKELDDTRQELKNTENRFRQLEADLKATLAERETTLQHSIVGIAFLTEHGRLRWANDALTRIFGTALDGATGQSLEPYYRSRAHYLEVGAKVAEAVAEGRMFESELMLRRRDGSLFWAYLSGKAVDPHDLSQGTVWVVMDISHRRELEARLKNQTAEQDVILQTSQIGIAHTANRIHQWVNRSFCEMVGFRPEELIGQSSRCHFPDDETWARLGAEAYAEMALGHAFTCETRMMRKNGEIFWVQMRGKNIDPENPARGAIWTVIDVTEQNQLAADLQQRTAEQDVLLQTCQTGLSFTRNRVIQWINRSFVEMLGFSAQDLIGSSARIHFPSSESFEQFGALVYPVLLQDGVVTVEWPMMMKSGESIWLDMRGKNIDPDDPAKGTIWSVMDISRRKQAEEDTLRALEKQMELNELKSRFVSMTSHEFRTPLATILSSTELLRYYSDRLPQDEKTEILTAIENSVRRMTSMLDNVLLIGKAEADMLRFKPAGMNLSELCRACACEAETTSNSANRPRLEVAIGPDIGHAMADETLLRHILGNLLSNAFKYSPAGGTVRFSVLREGGKIVFRISDEGIGIPPEELPRLFGSFHRAENVGNIQGTGLGLAIVKKSLELHGGSIEVESELGRGTHFTASIPDTSSHA